MSTKRKVNGARQSKTSNNSVETNQISVPASGQNVKIEKMMKQHEELMESQKFISMQYDDVVKELKKCVDANNELKKELAAVSRKCIELNVIVSGLQSKQNRDEQERLNRNVIVRGIKYSEDAHAALHKIAVLSDFALQNEDVISVKQQQFNNKDSVITAQFREVDKKKQFVKAAKQKKISTQMYGYDGASQPIYVDPQITRESFLLFKAAKQLKKVGVRFVWLTIDGEILVREKPNAPITNIKNAKQIREIEKAILLRDKTSSGPKVNENARPLTIHNERARETHNTMNYTNDNSTATRNRNVTPVANVKMNGMNAKNSRSQTSTNNCKPSGSGATDMSNVARVGISRADSGSSLNKRVTIREDLNGVIQLHDTSAESNDISYYSDADDSTTTI